MGALEVDYLWNEKVHITQTPHALIAWSTLSWDSELSAIPEGTAISHEPTWSPESRAKVIFFRTIFIFEWVFQAICNLGGGRVESANKEDLQPACKVYVNLVT